METDPADWQRAYVLWACVVVLVLSVMGLAWIVWKGWWK